MLYRVVGAGAVGREPARPRWVHVHINEIETMPPLSTSKTDGGGML